LLLGDPDADEAEEEEAADEAPAHVAAARRPAARRAVAAGGKDACQQIWLLARSQADLGKDLEVLAGELQRTREQCANALTRRCKQLREEKQRQVKEFLSEGEGLEYFKARLARLTVGGAMTQASAEQQIFAELVLDAQDTIQRRASEELGPQWQEAEELFRTRSTAILDSLEDVEERAAPVLKLLRSAQRDGKASARAAISASGFSEGLAVQLEERVEELASAPITAQVDSSNTGSLCKLGARTSSQRQGARSVHWVAQGRKCGRGL